MAPERLRDYSEMNKFSSPRPLWAAIEAGNFVLKTVLHKGAGRRTLHTHLKNAASPNIHIV